MDGLVRFYVNNSPVSVSGTTSAAGLPYQIAFARPHAASAVQAPTHYHSAYGPSEAVGGNYAQQFGQNPVYDSSLNDLIDRRYYQQQPQLHQQNHLYSNSSPLSNISTALDDDDDDEESRDISAEAVSDSGAYFASGDFGDRAHYAVSNPDMTPTADFGTESGRRGRLSHRHSIHSFDGSNSKSMGRKQKKFKNPHLAQQQRRQANLRERRRMKSINHAFDGLRQKIPTLPYEKKLSKVDTLKLAINYIQFLQELIDTDEGRKANGNEDGDNSLENSGSDGQKPNARGQKSGNRPSATGAPPAKKIIIECRSAISYPEGENADMPPLRGHSLSWSRVGEGNSHSYMTAKVWRPQQQLPQQPSDQPTLVSVDGTEPAPSPASSASRWFETDKFQLTTPS